MERNEEFNLDIHDLDLEDLDIDDIEEMNIDKVYKEESIKDILNSFDPIISSDTDTQKGVKDLRKNQGMGNAEDWVKNPGRQILNTSMRNTETESQEGKEIQYPLILVEVVTQIMLDRVKKIVLTGSNNSEKNSISIYLKMGEDAVFLGKSNINHIKYNKLLRLGLRPLYYETKGVSREYNPEDLFDPAIYNPRILGEDEIITEEPINKLIPELVYEDEPKPEESEPIEPIPALDWDSFHQSATQSISESEESKKHEVDLEWI